MTASRHSLGLAFKRLDLHLHTPASTCFRDRSATADRIVDTAIKAGLAGIAVTDHNSGAWVDQVKVAAQGKPLTVFPGVEITCQGGKSGLHIIALLDPAEGRAEVDGLLGELGLLPKDHGKQEALVNLTPTEVLEIIAKRGGLGVLAHANSSGGALADMQGEQRTLLFKSPHLFAAEGTDFEDAEKKERGKRAVDLLNGTDQNYPKRAVYQASDNPLPDGSGDHGIEGIGTRCAYFKLDRVNLEGLRQCFHDPDVRIRQDFEFKTKTFPRIVSMRVASGFLDGAEPVFHEGLNSILGSKGAGKSLLVEFLRFALDQAPENPEIEADHSSKLSARLQEFGTVEVVVADETGKQYSVKRTLQTHGASPYSDPSHADIARLFPVLFLSQNEIIKIAETPADQIAFIDRFFDFRSYRVSIAQLENDLATLDKAYADCLRAMSEAAVLAKSVASTTLELGKLNDALKNPVFEDYQKLELKDRAFREQAVYLRSLVTSTIALHDEIKAGVVPALPESFSEDPALKRVRLASQGAKDSALLRLETLTSELRDAEKALAAEHAAWRPTFDAGRTKYEETVQKEGGNYKDLAAKRTKLVKELDDFTRRHAGMKARADKIKGVAVDRNTKLEELRATYEAYSKERRDKCAKFESESRGRLKLELHEATDRDSFRNALLSLKRGSYLRDSEVQAISAALDPGIFIKALINYAIRQDPVALAEVAAAAAIDVDRMRTLADFLLGTLEYEALLELQYKAMPEDRPVIQYCVGEGAFEPLDRLSIGQKCTAMLIMALSDGIMPVVIDQPEDSLDIRTVWEDMCQKIRNGKEGRQFVFTTHNASLAVASDSDKFIILEGEATKGRVVYSGSMDHGPVSDEVLKYLEGGSDTYRMKSLKYNVGRRLDART